MYTGETYLNFGERKERKKVAETTKQTSNSHLDHGPGKAKRKDFVGMDSTTFVKLQNLTDYSTSSTEAPGNS